MIAMRTRAPTEHPMITVRGIDFGLSLLLSSMFCCDELDSKRFLPEDEDEEEEEDEVITGFSSPQ